MDREQWERELREALAEILDEDYVPEWRIDPALWLPLWERGFSPEDALLHVLLHGIEPGGDGAASDG